MGPLSTKLFFSKEGIPVRSLFVVKSDAIYNAAYSVTLTAFWYGHIGQNKSLSALVDRIGTEDVKNTDKCHLCLNPKQKITIGLKDLIRSDTTRIKKWPIVVSNSF